MLVYTIEAALACRGLARTILSSDDAEILEVLGDEGGPPYLVRWEDDGHVSRFYPGSDAFVQHFEQEDRDSS